MSYNVDFVKKQIESYLEREDLPYSSLRQEGNWFITAADNFSSKDGDDCRPKFIPGRCFQGSFGHALGYALAWEEFYAPTEVWKDKRDFGYRDNGKVLETEKVDENRLVTLDIGLVKVVNEAVRIILKGEK